MCTFESLDHCSGVSLADISGTGNGIPDNPDPFRKLKLKKFPLHFRSENGLEDGLEVGVGGTLQNLF